MFKFAEIIDFSKSTADWMAIIEAVLGTLNDILGYFGIQLFAPEEE